MHLFVALLWKLLVLPNVKVCLDLFLSNCHRHVLFVLIILIISSVLLYLCMFHGNTECVIEKEKEKSGFTYHHRVA